PRCKSRKARAPSFEGHAALSWKRIGTRSRWPWLARSEGAASKRLRTRSFETVLTVNRIEHRRAEKDEARSHVAKRQGEQGGHVSCCRQPSHDGGRLDRRRLRTLRRTFEGRSGT